MIGQTYTDYIQELFVAGMPKDEAKKKFFDKWCKENRDSVWKEEGLARKTFEMQWTELEKWEGKRLIQAKRKKALEELAREEAELGIE